MIAVRFAHPSVRRINTPKSTFTHTKPNYMKSIFRSIAVVSCLLFAGYTKAQVTGVNTVPGTFATIEAAVTALNTFGVGPGGATINVAAGYTETPTTQLVLTIATNSPSASNPLVIQKSGAGANPLITAFTPGVSATLDGIFILNGVDYVTINGIDLQENAANTTATMQMEFGYALLKTSTTNGAQNNTIKNCTVTLNKANTASVGIYLGNHTTAVTTALTVASVSGTSSFNKFYNNTVQNAYVGISITGYASAAPYDMYDQMNEVGVDGTSTRRNQVINYGGAGVAANGVFATNQNKFKVFNTYVNSTGGTNSTGTLNGISLVTGTNSNVDIYNDTVTVVSNSTTGSAMYAISNSMGGTGAGSTVNIYNNVVSGCSYPTNTTGDFRGIATTATATNTNIYNNTVNSNSIDGTGAMSGIYYSGSSATLCLAVNIYNNTVNGNTKTGTAGNFYMIYASASVVTMNTYGNNLFNNSAALTSGQVCGYYNFAFAYNENVYNNNIYNNTGGTGETVMMYVLSGSGPTNKNVYGNTIHDITTSANAVASGAIYVSYGYLCNIYNNNIYKITNNTTTGAVPAVYGINIGPNTNLMMNVYNNYLSEISAPSASNVNAAYGMWLQGTTGSAISCSFNTIYMNGTTVAANNGTAGIACENGATSIELRSNIVVNTSAAAGTGTTRALKRATTALTNYAMTSGHNCLYAGVPSATNLIFSDGTNNDQTIQSFINRVNARDQASFSEMPPFVNSAASPYNLHLQAGPATGCESGGISGAAVTTDYDGNSRGATPDVGADEISGTMVDNAAPNILYTALGSGSIAATRTCTSFATVTDPSGVNTTIGTRPRMYYKRTTNANTYNTNTNATDGWKYVEASNAASPFSFTIDYSLLFGGGVAGGDVIQYFVVAQDLDASVMVGINSGAFATQPTSVNLTAAQFPLTGTINQYTIVNVALSGTINVGPTELITSLTNAGGIFQAINASVLSGNLTINITGDLTAETGTFALNQWAEEGAGGYTVNIVPSAAVTRNIYGSNAGAALIRFDGADRVNIDGRFASAGTYLMFRNTSNSAPTIGFLNDAQNNTVQYSVIESGNTATSTTLGGAIWIGSTTGPNGNDNITISNCEIRDRSDVTGNPSIGINCVGNNAGTLAQYNNNCTFSNNNIHDWYVLNGTTQYGVLIGVGNSGFTISGNSFYQTVTRTHTISGAVTRAINISFAAPVTSNGGFVITGNFIGGTAPGATGGDMTLTVSGAGVSETFGAINVTSGLIPNSIQGNTIRKIDFTTNAPTAAATVWFGISVAQGVHNIGNTTGNVIGDASITGSIKITINAGGAVNSFIAGVLAAATTSTFNIQNNTISGITVAGTTSAGGVIPQWIQIQGTPASATTISGNTIGSTTTANSIQSSVTAPSIAFAIRHLINTGAPLTCTNNTIQNISENSTNASSAFYGVLMISTVGTSGTMTFTGNTVRDLSFAGGITTPAFGLLGLSCQGYAGTSHVFSGNTFVSLYSVNTGAAQTYAVGFQTQGSSMGGTFTQNRIGDLRNMNTGATPGVVGVYISAGLNWTLSNNMISITNGSNTNLVEMDGIIDYMAAGSTLNLYYNSVFVGGSASTGALNTTCYGRGANANVTLRNNLFYNKRTGGTGAHVAIANVSGTPTTGWASSASNYNAFVVADTTRIGVWNVTVYNMSGFRAQSGGEANSIWETSTTVSSAALWVNTNIANLHINTSTYPEALGTPVAGITVDYDGNARSATFPSIGADELACSNIVFTATSTTNVTCPGGNDGAATVGGTGGNGITYSWAPTGGTAATATGLTAGTYSVTVSNICGNSAVVTVTITQPATLSVTATQTDVACNGGTTGSATASVTGGTPGYTYSWTSGGTGATESSLGAGSYTVTVTDANSCTTTQSYTITEPSALTAIVISTNVSCNGGNNGDATAMPSGGVSPYTYAWSSGGTAATETGLAAGSYTVTTTDNNGCTRADVVTIAEPTVIVSSMSQNSPSCNGSTDGDATVTPTGGTPSYTYSWSSGGTGATETNLGAGSYTVTVTDNNGCTHTNSITITEPSVVTGSATSSDPTTCGGTDGAIDFTPAGGTAPYTFSWSNGPTTEDQSSVGMGTYIVTVTDTNGCTGMDTVMLVDPTAPVVTYSDPIDTACAGALPTPPFTLTGESPAGGTWSGPGVTGNQFDASAANIGYNVITYTYTDGVTGCTGMSMDSIWVDVCLNVTDVANTEFTLYPNPNNGDFTIQINTTEAADILIYDAVGQLVSTEKVLPGELHKVSLGASGAYMVTMVSQNGERVSKRVIVTR